MGKISISRLDSTDRRIVQLLRQSKNGCRIARIVRATSKSEGAIRWRLLTLEAYGLVRAMRERGSTMYFLHNEQEHLEDSNG